MLKNDYIMRIIEQFINAMALILRYQKADEYEKALQTTGDTFTKIFGAGSDFFNSLADQDLINLLKTNGALDKDKTIMIAALLKIEGDLFESQKNSDESSHRYLKSLNLYLESYLNDNPNGRAQTISTDYYNDIENLLQKLDSYELPPQTKNRIWQYFEKEGKYSRAEDLLYELYEETPEDDLFGQGISFYDRLMQKNDQQLNAGDLPRDEVEEGRLKWLTFKVQ
jgi:hypothetical protein